MLMYWPNLMWVVFKKLTNTNRFFKKEVQEEKEEEKKMSS